MSIATAKQFLQKVQKNDGKREGTLAEVVRIAAADGFVFTAGEYESALKEHLAQSRPSAGELSEEDLGLVAGGVLSMEVLRNLTQAKTSAAEEVQDLKDPKK